MSAGPVSNARNRTREYPSSAIEQLSKSAIADLDREPPSTHGKTPQALIYSGKLRRFEGRRMRQMAVGGQIDENGSLPYKPRQLSAMPRSRPGRLILGRKRPALAGQHLRTYLINQANCRSSGQVVSGEQP